MAKNLLQTAFNTVLSPFGIQTITKAQAGSMERFKAISLQTTSRYGSSTEEIKRLGLRKPTNITFKMLRAIAKRDAICRICINVTKKSVAQSAWEIRVKQECPDDPKTYESERKEVYELFEFMNPNDENLRILLEKVCDDLLQLDAVGIEKVRSMDRTKIMGLNAVDGATIRPVYNEYGELGDPAYYQFINDQKVGEFSKEDFVYMMANPQNDVDSFGYGLSPIESILLQVQASLQADMHNIRTFSVDNVPAGILDLGDVSEDEALQFIALWEATVVGNTQAMKFVWGGDTGKRFQEFKGSNKDMQFVEYIDWLTRIKLSAYGLSSIDANMLQDVNRATAQVQQQISESRGVRNMKHLIEEYFTRQIIRYMGGDPRDAANRFRYLEFKFIEAEDLEGKKTRAETDKIYLEHDVVHPDEIRERDGMAPRPELTSRAEKIDEALLNQKLKDKKTPKPASKN